MLRIQRAVRGGVVFTVSGRLQADNLSELSGLLAAESAGRRLVLDLHDLILVDRDSVRFLRERGQEGIVLRHCPGYIRAWMRSEAEQP